MSGFRRFFARFYKSEKQLLDEFAQQQLPCDCPVCKPVQVLNFGHLIVQNPTEDLLREAVIWNELVNRTPAVRMQEPSRWTQ